MASAVTSTNLVERSDQIQWLIIEWGKCSFDQKEQKSIRILWCPASAKNTCSRDATSLCSGARKCNSKKYCCSDFLLLLSAGWMRHCKMWQEETKATVAGFQDCPGWERKKPWGLMLVAVGGSAAFVKARGGLLRALQCHNQCNSRMQHDHQ